jgi:hypothetical protein
MVDRTVICQAGGILMERFDIDADWLFGVLQHVSSLRPSSSTTLPPSSWRQDAIRRR